MAKTFEWDYKAAGELLLKSEEIASVCEEAAAKMTRATGVTYKTGRTTQRVVVEPEEGEDE
jgi:hypothetical protein